MDTEQQHSDSAAYSQRPGLHSYLCEMLYSWCRNPTPSSRCESKAGRRPGVRIPAPIIHSIVDRKVLQPASLTRQPHRALHIDGAGGARVTPLSVSSGTKAEERLITVTPVTCHFRKSSLPPRVKAFLRRRCADGCLASCVDELKMDPARLLGRYLPPTLMRECLGG